MSGDLGARVSRYLEAEAAEGRLSLVGSGPNAWDVMVPSYWKESVPVSLSLGDRTLRAEAFFMRAPEDNVGAAYRLLLERNLSSRLWRFAANAAGDVTLLAEAPMEAVDGALLDQLFGGLVSLTDETYRPFFKLAYERSLAEQVARGGPGLDQPPPWAREWDSPPGC